MTPEELTQFEAWGKPLPARSAHGTDDDIRSQLVPMKPRNWRQEGNKLIADVEHGQLVQMIPTDRILKGTSTDGLPILEKIVY